MIKAKFKKMHPNAVTPTYGREGDAALDLTAVSVEVGAKIVTYDTGIALELPPGYEATIWPRSSICKYDLTLSNSVGTIDQTFRGSLKVKFRMTDISRFAEIYKVGDRIAQLKITPIEKVELEEVSDLSESVRGDKGWGSSGN